MRLEIQLSLYKAYKSESLRKDGVSSGGRPPCSPPASTLLPIDVVLCLGMTLPEIVRDWKLDCVVDGDYTTQTRYISDPATGQWREPVPERWQRKKRLGQGAFGVVWSETCISGPSAGKVRAVKEIPDISTSLISGSYLRELEAIVKFSHEQVRNLP
jgi:hypothetical protein